MILRLLREADIHTLLAIEEAAQVVPWSQLVFEKCIAAGYPGWVMDLAGRVVAFIFISVVAGECHILNLSVHPQFQRRGLGRQLLVHALASAKRMDAVVAYLEVRRSNTRAITLYQAMGFQKVGERKDYYPIHSGHEDALVFAKEFIYGYGESAS